MVALLVAAFGTLTAGTLPGCHTAEGFGHDVEHLGDSIEDAAD
ncbi:MAG: entericidin A/B family lipoprotein [Phycisphaerales bacterium]|nr:entericidin A/B family lipoprotein [Phycisphaerae bacterium]NNF44229.1 entericidin A/B family lipoprotein [Phycisphaerales bacterium]NNM24610.1 entericidin A/B family lipoprotein [Phycisphaerales bacterium]